MKTGQSPVTEITNLLNQTGSYRSLILMILAIAIAYVVSKLVGSILIKVAQMIAVRADRASNEERLLKLRQVETFLSVFIAIIRASIVAVTAFFVWKLLNPQGSELVATIGAGAIFAVVAGGILNNLLKDLLMGANMIIEQWFTIGDYIKIEPFSDLSGVVEKMTLRSTRIRSISGEVIWVHNQNIQAVRVTPRGVRTLAVDVFVTDVKKATEAINSIIGTIPTGHLMLAKKLKIVAKDQWTDNLWRITISGQTTPGREWLVENYFIDSLEKNLPKNLMVQAPITRTADAAAEKRFKRAVRVKK
jgi:small conductance mechanosensitive channel